MEKVFTTLYACAPDEKFHDMCIFNGRLIVATSRGVTCITPPSPPEPARKPKSRPYTAWRPANIPKTAA